MELTRTQTGEVTQLAVKGRLDGYWSDHLASELIEMIREGARDVRLNLSEVTFLSSAGIRVLLQYYKKLKEIDGSLSIEMPSEAVKSVLEMAGLQMLLISAQKEAAATGVAAPTRSSESERGRFEVFDCGPAAPMRCHLAGDPALLKGARYSESDCSAISFPENRMALGLGAFGNDFQDCRERFGEFLAVTGAAAYLPTDGTNVPDYMLTTGALIPEVQVLYSIVCDGSFSNMVYFERKPGINGLSLSEVAGLAFETTGAETLAMALIGESAGLMGTSLRRSPAGGASRGAPFEHPAIREWLSFTPERTFARSLVLVTGVASRSHNSPLSPLLRPLGPEAGPNGHFHAAAFSYRPLRKGDVDLRSNVRALFETETLQSVIHLLYDGRDISGAGQSEFVRGACWLAPVAAIEGERSRS